MRRARAASGYTLLPLLLGMACVASGVAVVQVEHGSRDATAELTHQRQLRDELYLRHAQLQIEQATLAGHSRIERLAQAQLDMVEPRDYIIVTARPGSGSDSNGVTP
ncbi:MAG: cell division protein FtsL [Nevskiaceae bacterium]|nr:MAG: cell division protein FtsL [Nevskiaceae bacterium]TBR73379.1 MAG: cell division protein FtsL [Nevskiaceae bacterium]